MNLFFEEDGAFKAGTVLKQDGNAYQVELTTGRRTKVKGGHVLFEFDGTGAAAFMEKAQQAAGELDPGFLWEVAPDEEFDYTALAADYFSEPKPHERAAVLMALHANPVYFYRKGRGHYKKAPEEILKRALEAVEKRKRMEARRDEMIKMLLAGEVPEEIGQAAFALLLHPDKNSMEWKALSAAADESRMSPLKLLLNLGAIKSPYVWHVESFYAENFPAGKNFPASLPDPETSDINLPVADVTAFSIDDSNTTEVDDASSVTMLPDGKARIGIHIAAPSLVLERDSAVDKCARARMSTVYAPGMKTTMLPESWIQKTSLDAGKLVPCVSLYVTVCCETMSVLSTETRAERIAVKENLRYDKFPVEVTEDNVLSEDLPIPFAREIGFLWRFAKARLAEREAARGKPEPRGRTDWYFVLEGEGEEAKVHLKGRVRGAPVDLVVAELMIFANATWGAWLEEHDVAGVYRSQQKMGHVKMSSVPAPHVGLGVPRYAWSTSPLRRYVDMVNQRQILSTVLGREPVYQGNDTDFYAILSQFDAIYDTYNDFQRKMERYWSLRWIEQEGKTEILATVVKEDLVRVEGLPLMQRIPGLSGLERGQRIRLAVLRCDYLELVLEVKVLEVLAETEEITEEELEETAQEAEAPAEEKSAEGAEAPADGSAQSPADAS